MATAQPADGAEPFGERVETLFDELALAVEYDRPAILLAVYASELVRADAEAALTGKLRELGQTVVPYRVTGEADADIARHLAEREDRGAAVYFVSGLRWGGGRDGALAYRSLNLRREYFGEYRIRAVFWLTEREAAALPRHAPDFWVFRHRVVEFVERPAPEQAATLASEMAWQGLDDHTLREDTAAKIALREALLADLPAGTETQAARGELLYTLATLHRANREYVAAIEAFRQAIEIAEQLGDTRLASWSFNGLGNVYADLGRPDDAIAAYQGAIALDAQYATPWYGLGNVYRNLGRTDDAIAAYQQALQVPDSFGTPASAHTLAYNGLGNVYADLGRPDDAIAAYQGAIARDAKDAYPWNGLGNVYADLGRTDDAIAAYRQALQVPDSFGTPASAHTLAYNGLGVVYRDLGRTDDAIAAYQGAIALDATYATPWNGLGNVYADLGRRDDAIAAYQQAIVLDPNRATAHASLAACYRKQGQEAAYRAEIEAARRLMAAESEYNRACFEAILGNAAEALALLEAALAKHQVSAAWAARDPDFESLRDDPRFQTLIDGYPHQESADDPNPQYPIPDPQSPIPNPEAP